MSKLTRAEIAQLEVARTDAMKKLFCANKDERPILQQKIQAIGEKLDAVKPLNAH